MAGEQGKRPFQQQLAATTGNLASLWQRLGKAQRISLVIVLALVVGSFVFTISNPVKPRMIAFPQSMDSLSERQAFLAMLDEQKIPNEVSTDGIVRVPENQLEPIRMLANQRQASGERHDFHSWIYEKASITETTRRFSRRWENSKKREVESAISRIEGVDGATVIVNLTRRSSLLNRQDAGASASVFLDLDRSGRTTILPLPVARGIGLYVARGYGLKRDQVSITDNLGNSYDLSASTAAIFRDGTLEEKVRAEVHDLIESIFPVSAFKLLVDVQVDSATTTGAENTSSESGSSIHPSGVSGLSVSLFVDTSTIVKSLEREAEARGSAATESAGDDGPGEELTTSELIQKRVGELEVMLKNHFEVYGEKVVRAHVYSVPLLLPEPVVASVPAPTEAQIFLEENWNQLALLALALTGTVLFFIAVKKASPAHTRIPDVVREYQNFLEERIRVTEAHSKALDEGCGLSPAEQRADEDVVEELRRLAMEDPETVSKVLEEYAISIQADPPIEISRTQKAGSK